MCHGLTAYLLGDPTAKRMGRLSLNPMKHIDIVGLIMLATVRFGWAKPVPVDMRRFKNPKLGMAVTALAGPVSNLVLAALAMLCYAVSAFYQFVTESTALYYLTLFFVYTATLSVGLAVFNLLPIPPLDGSKILFAVIPAQWYWKLMRYERYGTLLLMGLLFTGILDGPLEAMRTAVLNVLELLCLWPIDLLAALYF
ncbi:MAG: site-2 protease family protein [Oscillospiraceae bacterium]|nr:site-2 protease family protein [Oscillospiraceae bacterium]